ncbi:hypothetical protein Hanom_Chr08g00751031 [Helianthus anomalus]
MLLLLCVIGRRQLLSLYLTRFGPFFSLFLDTLENTNFNPFLMYVMISVTSSLHKCKHISMLMKIIMIYMWGGGAFISKPILC